MPSSIRVALCDDSPALRSGLKIILGSDESIATVIEASSHQEMLEKHCDSQMDIVLTELSTDDPCDLERLRQFKATRPDVKFIVFSHCHDKEAIMKSLELGVQGFHDKKAAPADIIQAIHTVHNGGSSLAPCITTALLNHMSTSHAPQMSTLSQREQEVLDLVAAGKSNSDIASRLYISIRTVKFHVSSIFTKLKVKNRTEAAALWSN